MSRLGVVGGGVIIIVGLIFCGAALRSHCQLFRSQTWQVTPAEVLQSDVMSVRGRARSGVSYSPKILYGYTFGGKYYVGDNSSIRR
jgi:hypothetical protein